MAMDTQNLRIIPLPAIALLAGFLAWLAVYWFLPKPVLSYILAHELTHALWAALMGASIKKIRVTSKGGSVSLSKSNVFITLAPYFFPLYAVIVFLTYYILSIFFDMRPFTTAWLALTGFAWGFHATFTIQTLCRKQPDINVYGRLFSYIFIYVFNLLGICLWSVLISDLSIDMFVSRISMDIGITSKWCVTSAKWVLLWSIGKKTF